MENGNYYLGFRVAVKELDYPPIIENQMDKNMENEMEAGRL